MTVFLDENGLVPTLEQMPCPAVKFVEELRIDAVQLPHPKGQIALRGFDEEMIMLCEVPNYVKLTSCGFIFPAIYPYFLKAYPCITPHNSML